MSHIKFKSYNRIYLIAWLLLVLILVVVRLFVRGLSESQLFVIFIVYSLFSWIPVMLLNMLEAVRLRSYLMTHHRETYNNITYLPFFKTGGNNPFRSLRFLYSEDDFGDPHLCTIKRNYRQFIILALTVFISMPWLFIFLHIRNLQLFLQISSYLTIAMLMLWGIPILVVKKYIVKK